MVHATFAEAPELGHYLEISSANEARLFNKLPFGNDQLVIEVTGVNLGPALGLPR